MRRLLSVVIAAMLAASLSSCAIAERISARDDERELAHAQFNRIIEALNSGDAEALKAEFSTRSMIDDTNFDSDLARLFELLPDGVWSWRQGGCMSGGSTYYGQAADFVDCGNDIVLDSTTPVHLHFTLYTFNTIDPESVGLYTLSVTTEDDRSPFSDPWDGAGGLYVSDSPPVVGGRP